MSKVVQDPAPDRASECWWCGGFVVVFLQRRCGGGEAMDPIMGGPPLGPLGPDLWARVSVGHPCSLTRIRAVKWRDDSSTRVGKILIGSSISSSSSLAPRCPLPLIQ
jgi:hypothetical protein